MLGDDIVIKGSDLGNLYITVIQSLGVDVSKAKTHKSKHFFEFAKRYFYRSKEITHFPVSALKESSNRYYLLTNLLLETENKEWLSCNDIPATVCEYYKMVKHHRSKNRDILRHRSTLAMLVLKYTKGLVSAYSVCEYIIRSNSLPTNLIPDEGTFKRVFFAVLRDLFMASDPAKKPGKPLGLLAEQLVCHYTGQANFELGFNLVMADPILNC